jgi:voltage-gated potassium channel
MTTSGYGDMVPVTAIGRTLAGFSMLIGIAMLAMPVGIVANGVANEVRRRELLGNYQMVSRLPMFRGLHASAIADIAGLLRPQVMPGRSVVLTRGEMASSLYFIVDGEVEVQLDSGPVVLRVGDGHSALCAASGTPGTGSPSTGGTRSQTPGTRSRTRGPGVNRTRS